VAERSVLLRGRRLVVLARQRFAREQKREKNRRETPHRNADCRRGEPYAWAVRSALCALALLVSCGSSGDPLAVPLCLGAVPLTETVVVGEFAMPGAAPGSIERVRRKARTAAFLSSNQHAFSSRTARFIIQDTFPPGLANTVGGPLYGVGFSSLACSDVVGEDDGTINNNGNGLSGDFGSMPLYKDGCLVGAVAADSEPDGGFENADEERAAWAGSLGFRPAAAIFGDRIFIDGIALEFIEARPPDLPVVPPFGSLVGVVLVDPFDAPPDDVYPMGTFGGLDCEIRYPLIDSPAVAPVKLLSADVDAMFNAAAAHSDRLRAAIRRPLGTAMRCFIAVVDTDGVVLGCIRTPEATIFSFDVAIQKARTAAYFSSDTVAFTTRGLGFISQGFFPPGIEGAPEGPLLSLQDALSTDCEPAALPLQNGITIFPGGLPLYKGGVLVGAIGVSGDGVDQDDFAASAGAALFPPPAGRKADELSEATIIAHLDAKLDTIAAATADPAIDDVVALSKLRLATTGLQGIRRPYTKFPRQPFR